MTLRPVICRSTFRNHRLGAASRIAAAIIAGMFLLNLAGCGKQTDKPVVPAASEALPATDSPLIKASTQDDPDAIKAFLDAGADVNAKDVLGRTPLHIAAFYGHLKISELLIARGADINAKDRVGMTALHAAVLSGGRQEVELLLDKKADINAKSDAGQTALHLSASTGQPKLSRFLIEQGADPQSKDSDGKIPLFYAMQNQHPQTTALFQQYSTK